jgi:cytochrome b
LFGRLLLWSTRNNGLRNRHREISNAAAPDQEDFMTGTDSSSSAYVRIWDRPVRIVHWAMVLLVALAWWAVETGHMVWHYRFGYALLGLLLFRLIWGFLGSSTARFGAFVRGPRQVLRYLRGDRRYIHGHNPLGALSVIALLGILVLQVGLGLFAASPNGSRVGPFAAWVAPGIAHEAADLHKANFYLLLALIGVHVGAILFYLLFRRDDLITPMLTGRRRAPLGTRPMEAAPAWRLLIAVAAGAGIAIWLILSGQP